MSERISCLVPFCRRTRGQRKGEAAFVDGMEWICGQHWRHVSKRTKSILRRVKKRARRDGWSDLLIRISRAHWDKAKRQAIEAAAGIA